MVRDQEYMPAADAKVAAHVIGPEGMSALVDMRPAPTIRGLSGGLDGGEAGLYLAEVTAERQGSAARLGRIGGVSSGRMEWRRTSIRSRTASCWRSSRQRRAGGIGSRMS